MRHCKMCGCFLRRDVLPCQKICDACTMDAERALEACYAEAGDMGGLYEDEEGLAYFDRFIAGDR